jgi:hypothetical protein
VLGLEPDADPGGHLAQGIAFRRDAGERNWVFLHNMRRPRLAGVGDFAIYDCCALQDNYCFNFDKTNCFELSAVLSMRWQVADAGRNTICGSQSPSRAAWREKPQPRRSNVMQRASQSRDLPPPAQVIAAASMDEHDGGPATVRGRGRVAISPTAQNAA